MKEVIQGRSLSSVLIVACLLNPQANITVHTYIHITVHTGEKLYSCTLCPKSFAHLAYLKTPSRIHTGEKPFTCSSCEKSFGGPSALRQHS
jgi:uncharacterized Zn-finger protein